MTTETFAMQEQLRVQSWETFPDARTWSLEHDWDLDGARAFPMPVVTPKPQPAPAPTWEAFPEPRGWSMEWDAAALTAAPTPTVETPAAPAWDAFPEPRGFDAGAVAEPAAQAAAPPAPAGTWEAFPEPRGWAMAWEGAALSAAPKQPEPAPAPATQPQSLWVMPLYGESLFYALERKGLFGETPLAQAG